MIKIIYNTPVYVWPLLALLIWGGWKSRKTYIIAWKDLLIMPLVMFFWAISSMLQRYDAFPIYFWMSSMLIGIWLGAITVRRLHLQFDKRKKLIQIEGSWMPMILSLSIFSLRYVLGIAYAMRPDLSNMIIFNILENIAVIVSGMFLGRIIGYWKKYKNSSHADLAQLRT